VPFEPHTELSVPPDGATIWRYQSFTKFSSLLSKRALYFVAADRLEAFDPFEGSYTRANLQIDRLTFDQLTEETRQEIGISDPIEFKLRDRLRKAVKGARRLAFVNCWHVGEHESAAMWKIYATEDAGIAVRSTVGRLKASLEHYTDYPVLMSSVRYLNYDVDVIPETYLLHPIFFKRKSFQYENELRALVSTGVGSGPGDPLKKQTIWDGRKGRIATVGVRGLYAMIDVGALIETIYISPRAPSWFVELVQSVSEKFGLTAPITQSDLATGTLY
jgi:hypothetical protein